MQGSLPEDETDSKKPRRSDRLSHAAPNKTPVSHKQHLPSPVTHPTEDSIENYKDVTVSPPGGRSQEVTPRRTDEAFSQSQALSSPPQDTQPLSQFVDRHPALSEDIDDEEKEGVWGYLVPLDPKYGDKPLVLKKRTACPMPDTVKQANSNLDKSDKTEKGKSNALKEEEAFEKKNPKSLSGGYLIGRHAECGKFGVQEAQDQRR